MEPISELTDEGDSVSGLLKIVTKAKAQKQAGNLTLEATDGLRNHSWFCSTNQPKVKVT
jgi:hypothetical protein